VEVTETIGCLLESSSIILLNPGIHFWSILNELVRESNARGNLLYDAQIVAVCREYGIRDLLSEDRDFTRFTGIVLHKL